jgi:hypothetical protein
MWPDELGIELAGTGHGGGRWGAREICEVEADVKREKMEGERRRRSSGHAQTVAAAMARRRRETRKFGLTFARAAEMAQALDGGR